MTEKQHYSPNQLIKEAAKHGELVVFVGAGASMLCGSPDWRGFSNQVVNALENGNVLSFLESEQLRGLGDPRRTLSVSMALAKVHDVNIDFDNILHPVKPSGIGIELYKLLSDLRPVFVTTNYDKWLDGVGPEDLSTEVNPGSESEPAKQPSRRPIYYLREHLSPALLAERGAVIHLHGSYMSPESMVVSLKDYIEHYASERVKEFLSTMFKNYTVLFVGYGLAELEVLDYIIRSNETIGAETTEPRHFLLYACRSTESVQTKFIENFFENQCGVRVIPYCIDTRGYPEVIDVFKDWNSVLDVRDPTILDRQARLDRLVALPNVINREAALHLVSKWPELAPYFLNSLKDMVWFNDLDSKGYFAPEHSPGVKVIKSERGGTAYQAEGWPALRYLEQIAALAQGDQADRVLAIVRAISSDAQVRDSDNYRTWWSLATILSQVPVDVISEQDIEMARSWLEGHLDSNMVGHELGAKLLPRLLESTVSENWQKALLLVDALSLVRRSGEPS